MMNKHATLAHRRGRKTGDGILNEINPKNAAIDNLKKLAYGRYGNDPVAEMVLEWWAICEEAKALEDRRKVLGRRIKAVEAGHKATGRIRDQAAFDYLRDKGQLDRRHEDKRIELELAARFNLTKRNADWFRKVADVIEKLSTEADCYRLHTALMRLAELDHTVNRQGQRCYSAKAPLSAKPRYTIDRLATTLAGLRAKTQSDEDW
ncbi:MAG: hypothetical protein NT154_09475, partial [Verrucomicrobia bacterium]|nr:hypothetical protein [Verrucomicrobiota bacterium]